MPFPFTCFCNKFKPCKTEYLGKYLLPQIDERRQQVAAYFIPTSFHKSRRVGFAPRHCFSSLVTARLFLYFSHSYYFFVAITPGLQTTVSSVVWSACFCCCLLYRLQADFQPVRIPQLTKKNSETRYVSPNFLASPLKIDTFSILKNRFELMLKFVSLYCSKTTKLTL